jgi:hypothetical protein
MDQQVEFASSKRRQDWFKVRVGYRLRTNYGAIYRWTQETASVVVDTAPEDAGFHEAIKRALSHKVRQTDNFTVFGSDGPFATREAALAGGPLREDTPEGQREGAERKRLLELESQERSKRQREELEAASADSRAFVVAWTRNGVAESSIFMTKEEATGRAYDLVESMDTAEVSIVGPDFVYKETSDERLDGQIRADPKSKGLIDYYFTMVAAKGTLDTVNESISRTGIRLGESDMDSAMGILENLPDGRRNDPDLRKQLGVLEMHGISRNLAFKTAVAHASDEGFIQASWFVVGHHKNLEELTPKQVDCLIEFADLTVRVAPDSPTAALIRSLGELSAESAAVVQKKLFDDNPYGKS